MNAPATGPDTARPVSSAATATALDVVAYHYEPVKAPLLHEAVLPLARRAAEDGLTAHVERHWLHGPHLRLRLRGLPGAVAATAERTAAELRARAASHPSRAAADARHLLAQAAAAGRAELIPPPYGPLVPDNTVRVEPVDLSSLTALIGPDGVRLREDLLALGLPALAAGTAFLGERANTSAARVELVVGALAAHAAAHPEGLVGGHYSYVSHLEDFLVQEDPDGQLRAAFDRRWDAAGERITALVGRIAGGGAAGWERAWADWSARAWGITEERFRAGADFTGVQAEYLDRAAALGDRATAERWDRRERTRYSEFHRQLHRSDPQGTMWSRPDYLVYRACTNGLYRLLTVCDVRPVERYLAAHLVVRSVPELTGHRWQERIDEVIAAVEATP
ncbi:lantibiotic dehydratase C-terminal domain-containing protein [Streptomyces sp. KS 21]|uniref:lantibiotic dehydratase C-terminal domain-containing protein n=1 Tax=Streptomyces sp. KS 21 TaxID=2485150 RepID=UPI001062C30C|nr:lantibiotic dehydratase C-terminal domain-containing protein [Streptomyces sp. KS 21]TDU73967.1 lantibiotic biosynthesis dehydratase-like protein [Streptomyces sp. KS 21]